VIDDIGDLEADVSFWEYYQLLQNAYNLGEAVSDCMEWVWDALTGQSQLGDQIGTTVEDQFYFIDQVIGPTNGEQQIHLSVPFPDLNDGLIFQPVFLIPFNTETFGRGPSYSLNLSAN
jgi:hypothetical protein